MPRKKKTAMYRLDSIKETFFVRAKLCQERIDYFAGLYKAGVKLPNPQVVEGTRELFDGRHRKAALVQIGRDRVEFDLVENASRSQLILRALAANAGDGPLTPNQSDLHFIIEQLLGEGMRTPELVKEVTKVAPYLTVAYVRRQVADVQSGLNKAKVQSALNAVVDGDMSVRKAAEKFGADPETVKRKLKRFKRDITEIGVGEVKAALVTNFKSFSGRLGRKFMDLTEKNQAGVISDEYVRQVLDHIAKGLKQLSRTHNERVKRFEAMVQSRDKVGLNGVDESPTEPTNVRNQKQQKRVSKRVSRKRKKNKTVLEKIGLK